MGGVPPDATTTAGLAHTLLGVVVLAAVTWAVLTAAGIPRRWAPALAIARGAVQLAFVALVLGGLIAHPVGVAAALAVMFAVASWTAARRLGGDRRARLVVPGSMAAGVAVAVVVVFGTGALELTGRYALAIGGIVVGNAMSIATLAGRRLRTGIVDHWEEVEGWLALGATPRQATVDIGRRAVFEALVPTVDQTRTTGLVTLPGAFVGAIFGGLSPLEAGRFQVMVLAAIMAAGSVTAVLVTRASAVVVRKPEAPAT